MLNAKDSTAPIEGNLNMRGTSASNEETSNANDVSMCSNSR